MKRASRMCRVAAAALLAGALPLLPAAAQQADRTAAYSDEQVKAAFLYNFGTYVQWPTSDQPGDEITIAVLGAPAIAAELERFLPGRTIQGRPVRVRRLRSMNQLRDDELVFIGSDENWRLAQLIDSIDGRPTLIVTDAPDGLASGAMINFQLIEERVRFEISLRPAEEAGLMLSSRLLSAALRVETTRCWTDCRRRKSRDTSRSAQLGTSGEKRSADDGARSGNPARRARDSYRGRG